MLEADCKILSPGIHVEKGLQKVETTSKGLLVRLLKQRIRSQMQTPVDLVWGFYSKLSWLNDPDVNSQPTHWLIRFRLHVNTATGTHSATSLLPCQSALQSTAPVFESFLPCLMPIFQTILRHLPTSPRSSIPQYTRTTVSTFFWMKLIIQCVMVV